MLPRVWGYKRGSGITRGDISEVRVYNWVPLDENTYLVFLSSMSLVSVFIFDP